MLIFIYDDIICIPMKFVVGLDYRLAFLVSDFIQIYVLDLKIWVEARYFKVQRIERCKWGWTKFMICVKAISFLFIVR